REVEVELSERELRSGLQVDVGKGYVVSTNTGNSETGNRANGNNDGTNGEKERSMRGDEVERSTDVLGTGNGRYNEGSEGNSARGVNIRAIGEPDS
ncbi:MAG: hypothetical protein RR052_05335, partial [Oscillospiraceae bacterium]